MTEKPLFINRSGQPSELSAESHDTLARKFWGNVSDEYNEAAQHAQSQGWLTEAGVTESGRMQLEELVKRQAANQPARSRESKPKISGGKPHAKPRVSWNDRRFGSPTASEGAPAVSRRGILEERRKAKKESAEDDFLNRATRVVEVVLKECGRLDQMPNYTIITGRKNHKPMVRLELVRGNGNGNGGGKKKKGVPQDIEASAPTVSDTLEQLSILIRKEFGSK